MSTIGGTGASLRATTAVICVLLVLTGCSMGGRQVAADHADGACLALGTDQPESIPSLPKRACAGGDVYACGEHATAAETFR